MENSALSLEYQTSTCTHLSKYNLCILNDSRVSHLKEIIEKEMKVKDATLLDDRGIDITSMHNDDLV